jgi:DNA-binding LacI/PurR family transcriptional regulator
MDMLAAELAAVRPRCDGVFIPDDRITALIYPALLQQGIEPGRDIAVISCGNEATYLNCLRPRPATIDLAPETTGRLAVEQLLKISKHADAYERTAILVTPKLILGEVDGDYAQ